MTRSDTMLRFMTRELIDDKKVILLFAFLILTLQLPNEQYIYILCL
jgi:hypothetical protein